MSEKVLVTEGGRKLALRELHPGDLLDLVEAAGTASGSQAWMRMAQMLASVSAIDGIPIPMPTTKDAVRSLGKKIGNDGLIVLTDHFYPTAAEAEPGQSPDPEADAVKN